jgi:hypothetical protein
MIGWLLQATTNTTELLKGDMWAFTVGNLGNAVPVPVLALMVFGSIGIGYYMVQQSFTIPLIMFILVGSITIAQAPVTFTNAITALVVIAVAVIGYLILQEVSV